MSSGRGRALRLTDVLNVATPSAALQPEASRSSAKYRLSDVIFPILYDRHCKPLHGDAQDNPRTGALRCGVRIFAFWRNLAPGGRSEVCHKHPAREGGAPVPEIGIAICRCVVPQLRQAVAERCGVRHSYVAADGRGGIAFCRPGLAGFNVL